jgi:hypothetical protein
MAKVRCRTHGRLHQLLWTPYQPPSVRCCAITSGPRASDRPACRYFMGLSAAQVSTCPYLPDFATSSRASTSLREMYRRSLEPRDPVQQDQADNCTVAESTEQEPSGGLQASQRRTGRDLVPGSRTSPPLLCCFLSSGGQRQVLQSLHSEAFTNHSHASSVRLMQHSVRVRELGQQTSDTDLPGTTRYHLVTGGALAELQCSARYFFTRNMASLSRLLLARSAAGNGVYMLGTQTQPPA